MDTGSVLVYSPGGVGSWLRSVGIFECVGLAIWLRDVWTCLCLGLVRFGFVLFVLSRF